MRLVELAETVDGKVDGDADVRGISHDSREAKPGDLFVCLVGERFDGHQFAPDALARGASALCMDSSHADVCAAAPRIIVDDTRRALPGLAVSLFDHPSRDLLLVGVTGTNGKTTSTLLAAAVLRAAGKRCGTIGTLGAELAGEPMPSARTTPEADHLQALLAQMRDRGAEAVAMEVSSHALAQYRTDGCEFDGAIFTNLTQDHLDYHGSLEAYFESKLRLFRDYPAASQKRFVASVNLDDPRGREVAQATCGAAITYAIHRPADVRAQDVRTEAGETRFRVETPDGLTDVTLNIGGSFQVYNALGVLALAVGLEIPLERAVEGLASVRAIPGRFEFVPNDAGLNVVVDYAHTPDGLVNLLDSARRLNPARILVVFGCGGDRDRAKRPLMGKACGERADLVFVTSDNPRTEDPDSIIADILPGLSGTAATVTVEPDRQEAIAMALRAARPGDIVLIAGKGHEDYQEIAGVKHPFDDREVARKLLRAL